MNKFENYLISKGLKFPKNYENNKFFGLKGIQRYKDIILGIEKNNEGVLIFQETESLDMFYKFDIFMRREYARISKPIELHIKTKIINHVFNKTNNINLELKDFLKLDYLWNKEDFVDKNIPTRKRDKYAKWVKASTKDMDSIERKNGHISFYEAIDKMTIGNLIFFLRSLSDKGYKKIFKGFRVASNRNRFILEIEFIRNVRNASVHHNIFLGNKRFKKVLQKEIYERFFFIVIVSWQYTKAFKSFKKHVVLELNKGYDGKHKKAIRKLYGLSKEIETEIKNRRKKYYD